MLFYQGGISSREVKGGNPTSYSNRKIYSQKNTFTKSLQHSNSNDFDQKIFQKDKQLDNIVIFVFLETLMNRAFDFQKDKKVKKTGFGYIYS